MTTKTLRPADLKAEEPVWEGKWKNLVFDKSGQTYLGYNIYDSEDDAKNTADSLHPDYAVACIGGPIKVDCVVDGILRDGICASMHGHIIQIPWKEKD